MGIEALVGVLMIFTLGAVLIFSIVNKKKTDDRLKDPSDEPSALAADGDSHHKTD